MRRDLQLARLLWPADGLAAAVAATAGAAGLTDRWDLSAGAPSLARADSGALAAAGLPEVDVDLVEVSWPDLGRALADLAPAVLQVAEPAAGHLALLSGRRRLPGRGRRVVVLAPDGRRHRLAAASLGAALRRPAVARLDAALGPLLAPLALPPRRRRRARRALLAAHLAAAPGVRLHVLTAAASRPVAAQLRAARLAPAALALIVALAAAQALALGAWVLLGRGLLAGRLESGWLLAWALLLLTLPLARAAELTAAAALGRRAALLLRRRLATALLALAPGQLRGEGTGRLLGRLLAAESLERALLAGAPTLGLAAAELAGATAALAHGAAAAAHLALLATALAAAALLFARHARAHAACAGGRLDLAGRLVEAMAGHRTRLAQGGANPDPREDAALAACHRLAARLGTAEILLRTALPRAWLLAGLAALAPALAAAAMSPGRLAASLGGLLLAQAGLGRLAAALDDLAGARTAVRELRPILVPAAAQQEAGQNSRHAPAPPAREAGMPRATAPGLPLAPSAGLAPGPGLHAVPSADLALVVSLPATPSAGLAYGSDPPAAPPDGLAPGPGLPAGLARAPLLLEARDLRLQLPGRARPLLAAASLAIRPGERLLLEGPSGAGKSTLGALLAAQRLPDSGLLLLHGLDLPTLGAGEWRRRVVAVPQLHDNHLFADTLAWNLLLGRAWPPSVGDLADADAVCRELGLGPLLDRLPAGLEQRIGEAGWQLSDGEASRVCLARALLQDPDLLILDESLAALDPAARLAVLAAVERRARTLLLIAHPSAGVPGEVR